MALQPISRKLRAGLGDSREAGEGRSVTLKRALAGKAL
ncbi:hypothetical protein ALP86_100500 [Pseudomonas amygdali pv. mori]|uniref:Uncharacterized protein n=3 Tax=Pseudomonas syringae group genomosp. 2 TaxID=251698 RepID=A0A3M5BL08_PSESS|nr:hypothetical protein PSYMO_05183 [Pseudomonas amygdali pv. mori str. 301020]KPW44165.1 hypothetical protein ALO82_100498 [Pseudomonas syringae pv. broussonetiae]RMQ42873.1 hypothetical protein ALQ05_100361 [Pseudomonas amygdali pv. mori]RMS26110.1 hypothetical protein ALP70_100515 [Pseudomonas savastanoi]RMR39363.1 hypothetical protein ALP86_100500 [Pseudomonas amygdali pv. mori]